MIDTIRIRTHRPLQSSFDDLRRQLADNPNFFLGRVKVNTGGWNSVPGFRITYRRTGLRLECVGRDIYAAEVSLPRLLYGDNSHLIQTQGDVDAALAKLETLIRRFADGAAPDPPTFSRVDLVLQFRVPGVPASTFIDILRHLNHPSCRSGRALYDNSGSGRWNGVSFEAKNLEISAYDKSFQMRKGHGDFVRVEIMLRYEPLKKHLGTPVGGYPTRLDFGTCYSAYRKILLRFPSAVSVPPGGKGTRNFLLDLLGQAEVEGWVMPDGRPPVSHLADYFGKQTCRSYIKELTGRSFEEIGMSFSDLLPEEWPPPNLAIDPMWKFSPQAKWARAKS